MRQYGSFPNLAEVERWGLSFLKLIWRKVVVVAVVVAGLSSCYESTPDIIKKLLFMLLCYYVTIYYLNYLEGML